MKQNTKRSGRTRSDPPRNGCAGSRGMCAASAAASSTDRRAGAGGAIARAPSQAPPPSAARATSLPAAVGKAVQRARGRRTLGGSTISGAGGGGGGGGEGGWASARESAASSGTATDTAASCGESAGERGGEVVGECSVDSGGVWRTMSSCTAGECGQNAGRGWLGCEAQWLMAAHPAALRQGLSYSRQRLAISAGDGRHCAATTTSAPGPDHICAGTGPHRHTLGRCRSRRRSSSGYRHPTPAARRPSPSATLILASGGGLRARPARAALPAARRRAPCDGGGASGRARAHGRAGGGAGSRWL